MTDTTVGQVVDVETIERDRQLAEIRSIWRIETAPPLPTDELAAITLLYRLEGILEKRDHRRVTYQFIQQGLVTLLSNMQHTLRVAEAEAIPPHVPIRLYTGSMAVINDPSGSETDVRSAEVSDSSTREATVDDVPALEFPVPDPAAEG